MCVYKNITTEVKAKKEKVKAIDAMFIKNGENPYIIITFPNKESYRYSGFDKTEFMRLERTYRNCPGKLANYLKSKSSYVNCNKTMLTTKRPRDFLYFNRQLDENTDQKFNKYIYQVKKDFSADVHFSEDGEFTICGKEINNDYTILTNHFEENSVNCIHCIHIKEGRF